MKGIDESVWVSALKADTYVRWHVRREAGRLLARRVKQAHGPQGQMS
jgi:hypothetical protein